MDLRLGDHIDDETGEWEVIGRPFTTAGGKNADARVRKVGQPELTDLRTWGAHEHLSVTRAASAEESKLAKQSYRYRGYYIEVAVQEVGVKHFEGTATIFGSPESARSGRGPVHRCVRMGRT